VSQRPAELDATILSQCSTLFALRMVNDRDQALLRSAVADAAANLTEFVPSLGTREVLAFGEGVPLPARLKFKSLPAHLVPKGERRGAAGGEAATAAFTATGRERGGGATRSGKPGEGAAGAAWASPAAAAAAPTAASAPPPLQPAAPGPNNPAPIPSRSLPSG